MAPSFWLIALYPPPDMIEKPQQRYYFMSKVRLMTSFDTGKEEVQVFILMQKPSLIIDAFRIAEI